jgi:hypothetical protein
MCSASASCVYWKRYQLRVQLSEDVAAHFRHFWRPRKSSQNPVKIMSGSTVNHWNPHISFAFYLHCDRSDTNDMSDDKALDSMFDAMMAAAGPSQGKKKEVTYAEFQAMLDSTPLFMRETPKDGAAEGEGNDVLEALKSLVFEGEGDGEFGR